MTHKKGNQQELSKLLVALCEDRLTSTNWTRLEEILSADQNARKQYFDTIFLHGSLAWNAATDTESRNDTNHSDRFRKFLVEHSLEPSKPQTINTKAHNNRTTMASFIAGTNRSTLAKLTSIVALLCIVGFVLTFAWNPFGSTDNLRQNEIAEAPENTTPLEESNNNTGSLKLPRVDHSPLVIFGQPLLALRPMNRDLVVPRQGSDDITIVSLIDKKIREGWQEENIKPSAKASDEEWIRRVYLDIVGQIPSLEVTNTFLAERRPYKREQLIHNLLNDPRYVRNWSAIWSNLLVGRHPNRDVNRPALKKYLRRSFAENRPWNNIVADLVSAEGRNDENGATNFLIAHLNNQAVPATAITARLFLGTRFQCTQCHDHPFNDSKQNQFWELNSFFKQTKKTAKRKRSKVTGEFNSYLVLEHRPVGGPSYYSNRQSRIFAALPTFQGNKINPAAQINRRQELARLMIDGSDTLIATAMVNRMWGHFFGHGFTDSIDDMGPHNKPSHPILLKRLSREFVQSGYDLKRLISWICTSEAYQLSSRFGKHNTVDNPDIGRIPWFSRMYVKSMSAEQLYDSLLVATGVTAAQRGTWDDIQKEREEWLTQFVVNFETEENDEANTFEGTISSALWMMNSPVIAKALSLEPGTFIEKTTAKNISQEEKIRSLAMASLCRKPTAKEMEIFRSQFSKKSLDGQSRTEKQARLLQDIFWAYLNSNEFILIH